MSSTSPNLSLSYVLAQQAQKHVTVNESFRRLDALVQLSVVSRNTKIQPAQSVEGQSYILPSGKTGADWSQMADSAIAVFQDGTWTEIAPVMGWRAFIKDENLLAVYNAAGWNTIGGGSSETASKFGVNTAADDTNRMAVKSDALLFSHDDVTPGSGDCRITINKATSANTASQLFQTSFSAHAELGLTGDDDFRIKVSPDNFATSYDAIIIDKETGHVGVNGTPGDSVFKVVGKSVPGSSTEDVTFESEGSYFLYSTTTYSSDAHFHAPTFIFKRAGGTKDSPSNLENNYNIGNMSWMIFSEAAGSFVERATIRPKVDGTPSGTSQPVSMIFRTGDTSLNEVMTLKYDGGVIVGAATGGSKGPGTINAQAVYDDNALLSCYVFDQALDGVIDFAKWDQKVPNRVVPEKIDDISGEKIEDMKQTVRRHMPARKFAERHGTAYDPLTLDGYAAHWREKRHLSSLPNEDKYNPSNDAMGTGEWIQRLVESVEIQAVLIEQLNEKLKMIEKHNP